MEFLAFLAEHPEGAVWVVLLLTVQIEILRRDVRRNSELAADAVAAVQQLGYKVESHGRDIDEIRSRVFEVERHLPL